MVARGGATSSLDGATCAAPSSPASSAGMVCCPAWGPTPPAAAATSSATGRGSSATAARSRSASRSMRGRSAGATAQGRGPDAVFTFADGRAVLRSSLREFLCSEAMHHLGVPTTRTLSLVATGGTVVRDMLYDGNQKPAGCGGVPGGAVLHPFRQLRDLRLARRGAARAPDRLHHRARLPNWPSMRRAAHIRWFDEVCPAHPRCWSRTGCGWASCMGS